MFRISLRAMLVLVAMVALAIASLKYANDIWMAIVIAVALVVLCGSLIVAVVDRGPRQAFAIGLALTMFVYGAVLTTGQRTTGSSGSIYSRNVEFDQWEGRLPTTRLLRYLHQVVDRSQWYQSAGPLQTGDSDGLVPSLQHTLNERITPSPNLDVDGDFGGQTQSAVRSFQRQEGLPVTGVVDERTWRALSPITEHGTGRRISVRFYAATANAAVLPGGAMGGGGGFMGIGGPTFSELPPREKFMPIGHCWWAMLLGLFGGLFATAVYRRRMRDETKSLADMH